MIFALLTPPQGPRGRGKKNAVAYPIHVSNDTTLYIIVDRPDLAAQTLNIDLQRISVWSELWLVYFNPNALYT